MVCTYHVLLVVKTCGALSWMPAQASLTRFTTYRLNFSLKNGSWKGGKKVTTSLLWLDQLLGSLLSSCLKARNTHNSHIRSLIASHSSGSTKSGRKVSM